LRTAFAHQHVGEGDACGQHSHPHFAVLRLGTLLLDHLKGVRPAVVSDDDARVSHRHSFARHDPDRAWADVRTGRPP